MMDVEQLKPVYDELKSLSVCDRCTIRLLNIKGDTLNYAKPLDYIEKVLKLVMYFIFWC